MMMVRSIKPQLKVTQMVSATAASKQFGSLREKARLEPQFVVGNNKVDTVILSYEEYEKLYQKAYSS